MSACVVCGARTERYDMCGRHWYYCNPALQKLLLFLFKEGRRTAGYAEALDNAKAQVLARLADEGRKVGRARVAVGREEEEERTPRPTARPILRLKKKGG